ncbi:MAG TPA: hypothetical protein VNS32_09235 [Flavisolibacter sp.]|nr:hypothetical protein [Flavisolibacter sp.]
MAGLSENESEFIAHYLKQTLKELSIQLPEKRLAALQVGLAIADEIFEGKRGVFEGTSNIVSQALDKYPFEGETIHYLYDSIGFAKVYGLYDTICDLREAGSQRWQPGKTNQALEQEVLEELCKDLELWRLQMKMELFK